MNEALGILCLYGCPLSKAIRKGDERILGDSGFIEAVMREADERLANNNRLNATGYGLDELARDVAGLFGVEPHAIYISQLIILWTSPRSPDILRRTLEEESIPCTELGGRQHYLRWQTPITARNLEAAGITYDSTLSHADRPGFRCGTSREFTMYDVIKRRPLALKQRPLVLMECSVIGEQYLGLGYTDEALALMLELKKRSLAIGGEFTLLWHNSHFNEPQGLVFYRELVKN